MILNQLEGDFVRVLFAGIQAEPRDGHWLECQQDATARRILNVFALSVDIVSALALLPNNLSKRHLEGRCERLLKGVEDALVKVLDFTFQLHNRRLEGLNIAWGDILGRAGILSIFGRVLCEPMMP